MWHPSTISTCPVMLLLFKGGCATLVHASTKDRPIWQTALSSCVASLWKGDIKIQLTQPYGGVVLYPWVHLFGYWGENIWGKPVHIRGRFPVWGWSSFGWDQRGYNISDLNVCKWELRIYILGQFTWFSRGIGWDGSGYILVRWQEPLLSWSRLI